ncbi:MAG: OB-fold nucleic acid binding domain-containing protein [Candidatus Pacearchaeota archaeon]
MKKIALILSITGIFLVLCIINIKEPKIVEISSIGYKSINKQVKIAGEVVNVQVYENNFTILTLKNKNERINVVCNCPNVQKFANVEITGTIQEYKKELQLNADKIIISSSYRSK